MTLMNKIIYQIHRDFYSLNVDETEGNDLVTQDSTEEEFDDEIVEIQPVSIKNGFLSETFVVKTRKLALFVKLPPLGMMGNVAKFNQAFRVENTMYSKVLPKLISLHPKSNWMIPKFFAGGSEDGDEFIILENLSFQGFQLQDRKKTLKPEYVYKVMKAIGEFHALGYVENQAELLSDKYPELGMISFPKENSFSSVVTTFADFLRENHVAIPEERMKHLADNLLDICESLVKPEESDVVTLCHRDLWTNNIMFKDNQAGNGTTAETDDELKLVDWQMCKVGGVGIDLSYFIFNCISYELLSSDLDKMLRAYHDAFSATMDQINTDLPIPSFDEIRADLMRKATYGFIAALMLLPLMIELKDPPRAPEGNPTEADLKLQQQKVWDLPYLPDRMGEGRRERMVDVFKMAKFLKVL